ncbi:Rieske (2Fe-2S) protein [Nocardioides caldifontis]|uniref:Rieske (2Fe-2S) protein n=1 Tax=Nocardioides caldifontis TaxID=2588938 RepID=UPI0011DF818F|nr:Rieske (2Fe-2S) protein [Nocardioides caldifontis]
MTDRDLTRRAFGSAALLGVAAPVLAACGEDEPSSTSGSTSSGTPSGDGSPSGGGDGGGGGSAAGGLVAAADVPVGGGVVLQDEELVVTQPSEGTFKGFSAICTHQGCLVAGVADGEISCNCHGSVFSADDGSVVNGPATSALEEVTVKVDGDQVTRG